jgi:hypothetical protein
VSQGLHGSETIVVVEDDAAVQGARRESSAELRIHRALRARRPRATKLRRRIGARFICSSPTSSCPASAGRHCRQGDRRGASGRESAVRLGPRGGQDLSRRSGRRAESRCCRSRSLRPSWRARSARCSTAAREPGCRHRRTKKPGRDSSSRPGFRLWLHGSEPASVHDREIDERAESVVELSRLCA